MSHEDCVKNHYNILGIISTTWAFITHVMQVTLTDTLLRLWTIIVHVFLPKSIGLLVLKSI